MATISDVVTQLESVGIFEFFLPFVLIFAIVYGMLHKTKIFGDSKDAHVNKINAIIAFSFALFIMIYPTTSIAVFEMTDYIANFVGGSMIYFMAIIIFIILMFMIATPLSGGETPKIEKSLMVGGAVAAVLVIALFLSSGGLEIFPGIGTGYQTPIFTGITPYIDPSIIGLVLVLLVIVGAIYWVTKGS